MPRVTTTSPATNKPTPSFYIHVANSSFVDSAGRVLILRGVNLSGSDKAPVNRPSQNLDNFWETAENGGESFVGRPLDVDSGDGSADIHLARLRGWGFNVIRYVVTWEALEHEGPGKYDFEFMDYTVRVLRKIKEYGFKVYMDPHQDVWSRYSGGSGAPYWTLPACGLNPRNFTATLSSIIHSEYPLPSNPHPETLPAMIWSTNYTRLVSQTVWTMFFAGRQFAPKAIIDGENIQDWLQSHFITAFGLLADRIRDAGDLLDECIIGWDSINEPGEGFLGLEDVNKIPEHQALKKGPTPTPIQSLRLGMGIPQTVDNWDFGAMGPARNGSVTIDPAGRKIWSDPSTEVDGVHPKWGWKRDPGWELGKCLWASHGVWDPHTGQALVPDYFLYSRPDPSDDVPNFTSSPSDRAKLSFVADYWRPHWRKYSQRIRESHPEAIHFIQPPVFVQPPPLDEDDLRGRGAYSAHYYDGLTLMTRHWNWFNADALGLLRGRYHTVLQAVKIGSSAIRASLREQLGMLKSDARDILGPAYPTLIGEIGTPMDMDGKRSYGWTDKGKFKGDYSQQVKALDASLNAADGINALSYTMWTYCPDSTHSWGDGWNLEDLSIWSQEDIRPPTPHLKPSRSYVLGPSPSDAHLIHTRSRATSLSSGTDGEEQVPKPTMATGTSPALFSSESVNSVGTLATITDDYQLRSRTHARDLPSEQSTKLHTKKSVSFPHPLQNEVKTDDFIYTPSSNPFDFFTDGARAVAAFARPYPQAIVGMSKTIDFDMNKAELKFVVTVRPGDSPAKNLGLSAKEENPMPTEIFLPLVHFASDAYITGTVESHTPHGAPLQGAAPTSPEKSPRSLAGSIEDAHRERSDTLESSGPSSTIMSSSLTLTRSFPPNPLAKAFPTSSSHYTPNIPPEAFSISVEVSHGSWMLDSETQTLKWWYPCPLAGEKDVEYSISIKRVGGPIRRVVDGTSTRALEEPLPEYTFTEGVERCCGACTIM